MSKVHNFVESSEAFGKYNRVIYCTQCGLVVWDFNYPDSSVKKLQEKVGNSCIDQVKTVKEKP